MTFFTSEGHRCQRIGSLSFMTINMMGFFWMMPMLMAGAVSRATGSRRRARPRWVASGTMTDSWAASDLLGRRPFY